jgi:hypothetical protein
VLVGHYAPALALKRLEPRAPLGALFFAAQAVDVAFFLLSFVGLEGLRVEPGGHPAVVVTAGTWTHSLLVTPLWALAGAALGFRLGGARVGAAIGAAVASHWALDFLVHVPDLPLGLTQEPAVGLGLWAHPPWALVLELALVAASTAFLLPSLPERARSRTLRLAAALVGVQLLSDLVVPLPSSTVGIGLSALATYLVFTLLAFGVDRAAPEATGT